MSIALYPRSPVSKELAALALPRVMKVRQKFEAPEISDVPAAVEAELERVRLRDKIRPGASVAITAGSRGISSLPVAARTVAAFVRRAGGAPFIVPAMGSHGGSSAEGQVAILRELGVTEDSVGAPIRAGMEVAELGKLPSGMPVYMDRYAASADGIILVNRIKPHMPLGHIGSGLIKMAIIGLGKQIGCSTVHAWIVGTPNLYRTLAEAFELARQQAPIILGVGIIDNPHARPGRIIALPPEELKDVEPELLKQANAWVARVPFDPLHVMVIDRMGKNLSPAGIDNFVIGRPQVGPHGVPCPGQPNVHRIALLSITPESHGNAVGLGMADLVSKRFFDDLNFYDIYMNAISGGDIDEARMPLVLPCDREVIQAAIITSGAVLPERARLVRVDSTLHLEEFYISEALVPELPRKLNVESLGPLTPMGFDEHGNLF